MDEQIDGWVGRWIEKMVRYMDTRVGQTDGWIGAELNWWID